MKIVFLSNYFNHHQQFLSEALYQKCDSYYFVETEELSQERIKMGWSNENAPSYVIQWYKNKNKVNQILKDADIIIVGSAPNSIVKKHFQKEKIIFRYAERPLKKGLEPLKYIPRLIKWHIQNPMNQSLYLLCASAYAAGDFAKFGLFKNKSYKWGYFPEIKEYGSIEELISNKRNNSILWCGRLIEWKHPDAVIQVAQYLKQKGYRFQLNVIGCGKMETQLCHMIEEYKLEEYVHLLGSMKPEQVRQYMEQSQIYLFTSDCQEGWGAVLNESMNSGCAVVVSHAIGSTPFLIKDSVNGFIYESGNIEMLCKKVKYLLDYPDEQIKLGKCAYETIIKEWNVEIAAQRFINLAKSLLVKEESEQLYLEGPCSQASIIEENWFKKIKKYDKRNI